MPFPADQTERFTQFASNSVDVTNISEFERLIVEYVQPMLPHGLLLAVIGQLEFDHLKVLQHVAIGYPKEVVSQLTQPINLRERPLLQQWLHTRAPVVVCTRQDRHKMSSHEQAEADFLQLGRLAIHGLPDLTSRMGSYFSFARVSEALDAKQVARILAIITPLLHVALTQATSRQWQNLDQTFKLTSIEQELLGWIAAGRSNDEIARLRHRSPATIRNQLATLYEKLGVANRAEAASLLLSGVRHVPGPARH
jgi:DNA-binding CsgD family transcriptional regulator